ncbi:MAG: SUMF1/EgtB/PvdO family nonheme iron enzyme [Deltaproteobacteria bacterium]|nr:SUMF1/EgtB/PvdO family nonheme iron enzyme [Deltaproteobacteria bacterium]
MHARRGEGDHGLPEDADPPEHEAAGKDGKKAVKSGKKPGPPRGEAAGKPLTIEEMRAMAFIPAGEFTMGSDNWWPKSQPEHKRSLDAFYIDRYEVTNLRYKAFTEKTGRPLPDNWKNGIIPQGMEAHPVVYVSWNDADEFCRWEGRRLPKEAEWEKAARGADKRTFPWGDKFSRDKANTPQLGLGHTMPVGSFEDGVSPYGVHDMAGNVWEWVEDWFKAYPGNNHPDENYGERFKSVRGGSWYDCTYYKCGISAPAYNRIFFHPVTKNNNFGFRCAKDAKGGQGRQ